VREYSLSFRAHKRQRNFAVVEKAAQKVADVARRAGFEITELRVRGEDAERDVAKAAK
jgi:hypothetical protein